MTGPPQIPAPEALLAQQDFVRALVRSLLRGADGEDDLVQSTWLRALRRPPTDPGKGRSWLARIARNLARDHARQNRRRGERERRAARSERVPSAIDVLQREAERRRVVDAVLALPEPYRSTVLMRYWDNLRPARIAERLGVPGSTVRSQLRRGLEMLRRKLDDGFGARSAWVVSLSRSAESGGVTVAASLGALLMSTKLKAVGGILLLGVLGLVFWSVASSGTDRPPPPEVRGGASAWTARLGGRTTPRPEADGDAAPRQPVAVEEDVLIIRGTVEYQGVPFPDLPLRLQWYEGDPYQSEPVGEHSVRSDAQGEFVWQGPPPDTACTTLVVSKDTRYKVWGSPVIIFPDEREAVHELTVTPLDCVLTGVVRDDQGHPIQDAGLNVNGWHERWYEARTDERGRYNLPVPNGPDTVPLLVWAEGHAESVVYVDIPEHASTWTLDVTLQPGNPIAGHVFYPDGTPVEGAEVEASGSFVPVVTDADGFFSAGNFAPLGSHRVAARMAGFAPASVSALAGKTDVQIVLEPGLTISGIVVDPDGKPIRGAAIGVTGLGTRGFSRERGRFRLVDLGKRELVLMIGKRGYASARVVVEVAGQADDLVVQLEKGQVLRGRVTDLEGDPIAGASVHCGRIPSRDDTDADGRFELRDLPSGPFAVHAGKGGYLTGSRENVTAGPAELEIRLQRSASVAGRVLDGSTGQPLRQFSVAVRESLHSLRFEPRRFMDTDGYWSMGSPSASGRKPGATLHVEVRAEGYAPQKLTATAEVDPKPERSVILLYPAVALRGLVLDVITGEPIPGAMVKVMDPEDSLPTMRFYLDRLLGATSDAAGHFSMASVGPGTVRLAVIHPDYADTEHGPIHVGNGPGSMDIRIQLHRAVTIRGRIVGFENPGQLTLSAQGTSMASFPRSKVQEDGSFVLERLSPGTYGLMLRYRGTSRYVHVEVSGEDIDGIEIREREGRGVIRATVRGLEGGGVDIVPASDLPKPRQPATRLLDFEDGRFEVEGLAEGRYRIVVFDHEDSARSKEVLVDLSDRHEAEIVFELDR